MMAAVLEKLKVLDLTSGVAGSMTTMLLGDNGADVTKIEPRSEEHTSELQSLMRISYAVFCLKKKKKTTQQLTTYNIAYKWHTRQTINSHKHRQNKDELATL